MKVEAGKTYKTRGGWQARVVWVPSEHSSMFYAVHRPGEDDESEPLRHREINGIGARFVYYENDVAKIYETSDFDLLLDDNAPTPDA
jgi:hypothetical protein